MLDLLIGKMLMNALKALIKNPVKESFYGKRKEKINSLFDSCFLDRKSVV